MVTSISDRQAITVLVLLQCLLIIFVQASGNFPVNDDWAYAHSAIWLGEEGRIRLSHWIAPNIVPQTLLGGTLSAGLGFSFEILRHLTQVISLLTSVVAYGLYRSGKLSPMHSLFACLVLISMPSWPVLANSYMTDLYGLLLGLAAAALFLRALTTGSQALIAAATVVVCIGMLQRQVLLVLPFAFALSWLWQRRDWRITTVGIALFPLLATVLTELAFYRYLSHGPGVPDAQLYGNGRFIPLLLDTLRGENGMRPYVVNNFLTMTAYLGWFLAAWFAWWGMRKVSTVQGLMLLAALVVAALAMQITGWLPPYLENNTIDRAGIGPFTLYDGLPRNLAELDRSPGIAWRLAGIAAAIGCVGLIQLAFSLLRKLAGGYRETDGQRVFLALALLAYACPFVITGYFDRYLLFVIPFLILLWAQCQADPLPRVPAGLRLAAVAWTGWMLVASAVATHDYFAWNRARWDAIGLAVELGATPDTLDGGFEYNGFHRFEILPRKRYSGKSFWWVKDDEFAVTFSVIPGYSTLQEFPVSRLSKRTPPLVRLMRRDSETSP